MFSTLYCLSIIEQTVHSLSKVITNFAAVLLIILDILEIASYAVVLRGHHMQNSLLHVVWSEMCVGSMCTQPPYNDKNPLSAFFKSR